MSTAPTNPGVGFMAIGHNTQMIRRNGDKVKIAESLETLAKNSNALNSYIRDVAGRITSGGVIPPVVDDTLVTINGTLVPGAEITTSDQKGDSISAHMYQARGETRRIFLFDITATSTNLHAVGEFLAGDAGLIVTIPGAGVAGAPLVTTVAAFVDADNVTLTDPAVTSVTSTGATVAYIGRDETAEMLATLVPTGTNGETVQRILPTGNYFITPGDLLIPNPQSGLILGHGSRFNTALVSLDPTSPNSIWIFGDNVFEPHNYEVHNVSVDANYGSPIDGAIFFNKANWMGFFGITAQHFGPGAVGIGSNATPVLFGENQFFRCSVYSGDMAAIPSGTVGVLLYPTGNIEFYATNIENVEFGVWMRYATQSYFLYWGGHLERIGSHAFILENCQPTIDTEAIVGDFWFGNDVVNGDIRLTANSGAWSNGGIVDNGFGNRILRTASQLFTGDKAAFNPGLNFQGNEWLNVDSLETDPTFTEGAVNWSAGASATLNASMIVAPGVPTAGKSLLIYSAAGGGYATRTYTAEANTDYLLQVGILTRGTQTYKIEVRNSGGLVWSSGNLTYPALNSESQSFKVIRKSIPVVADTQFTVRIYSVDAGQTSIIPLLLISRSQIQMEGDFSAVGAGFTDSGTGITYEWQQETLTGKVYSVLGTTLTTRAFVRAVVTMASGKSANIGITGDANDPTGGPQIKLLAGTDVEYIIPLQSYPTTNQAIFYSLSGVSNILTIKEVGVYAINDTPSQLVKLSEGWIRNDRTLGVPQLSTEQFRLWLGLNENGNWQAAASAGNSFTRAIYASNIYWDQTGGNWVVPNNGAGDWAALLLLNSGEIGLACESGLILPTTRTTAQVLAAIKFKIPTADAPQFLTGALDLISGSDQAGVIVYNGDPNSHVARPIGYVSLDPNGPPWAKTGGGAGNTGWTQLATGSGFAPANATYITQTPDGTLTNEQALSALATGILKNTTATGVLSIAAFSDLPAPGAETSYTPTISPASGTYTATSGPSGRYTVWGKEAWGSIFFAGSNSALSAYYDVSLPFTPNAALEQTALVTYRQAGSLNQMAAVVNGSSLRLFVAGSISGSTAQIVNINFRLEVA